MRSQEEIVSDLLELVKFLPDDIAKKVILLAHELAEVKALRLTEIFEQAREARDGSN